MKVSKKKIIFCILYSIIAIIGMGSLIFAFRLYETKSSQKTNFAQKQKVLEQSIEDMETEKENLSEQYDSLYESKSDAIALLGKETSFELNDSLLAEIKNAMNVENCIVIDKKGNVVASAGPTKIDFTAPRYNQLRAIITDPNSYAPMTVDFPEASIRFYASLVSKDRIGIICVSTAEMEKNIQNNTSLKSILSKIHVGQNGFVAAVDARTYDFLYYPDEEMIGQNVTNEGENEEQYLSDGFMGFASIGGKNYYCSVMEKDDVYYILAVPKKEIVNINYSTAIFTSLLLAIVFVLLIIYYIFSENERKDISEAVYAKKGFLDKVTAKKMNLPAVLGILLIFLCTYYFQTLFNMSSQSVTNNARIKEAVSVIESNDTEKERLTEEYNENYLEKCQLAAFIIGKVETKQTLTQEFMISLREALKVEEIWYLDMDGKTIASDQDFWSWQLSQYEGDQSYDFWMVLEGQMPYLIQDPCINDYGYYSQYIGVAMMDDSTHHSKGMVQIGLLSDTLETKLMNNTLPVILKKIQIGNSGFAFAINKEKKTFDYYPDSNMMDKSVKKYGISDSALKAGFMDFINIDGVDYYATSMETDEDFVYIAVPYLKIIDGIFTISFVATVYSIIVILLFWYFLSNVRAGTLRELIDPKENEQMVDVKDGAGRTIKSKSFTARFNHSQIEWNKKTAAQKLAYIFRGCITVLSIFFLYIFYNADVIFKEDSMILYILNGNWQKKLNIFSLTSCIIGVVIVNIIVNLVREFLSWLSHNVNAKMLTIIRLIDNFLKFAVVIGCIYYCLGLIGVDTKTLVTSAGILTLIVGLGANSLVSDIISGLFLILEGDFQVGDIVTIDGFRGTVLEIGIRTVKIQEGSGNVKVISNRNASNVLNMTKHHSVIALDMSIEYGENLEYVEYVLHKELPLIKKKLPTISEGPFYKGVSALGDNSVDIKILCKCKEEDRMQLDRDLRRELKLIFDRYKISIPYPQVVVNEPQQFFHHAPSRKKAEKVEVPKTDIVEEENGED